MLVSYLCLWHYDVFWSNVLSGYIILEKLNFVNLIEVMLRWMNNLVTSSYMLWVSCTGSWLLKHRYYEDTISGDSYFMEMNTQLQVYCIIPIHILEQWVNCSLGVLSILLQVILSHITVEFRIYCGVIIMVICSW